MNCWQKEIVKNVWWLLFIYLFISLHFFIDLKNLPRHHFWNRVLEAYTFILIWMCKCSGYRYYLFGHVASITGYRLINICRKTSSSLPDLKTSHDISTWLQLYKKKALNLLLNHNSVFFFFQLWESKKSKEPKNSS